MRPLKRDPAPSRLGFRLKRLWRSERFRRFATIWTPALVVLASLGWAAAQEEWRVFAVTTFEETRAALKERPEFAIRRIEVRGASPEVEGYVRAILSGSVGASSLDADVEAIRAGIAEIGWVAEAKVRLAPPETLMITVRERVAEVIWRRSGRLSLIDREGVVISPIERRDERPDLPVIAGAGAERAAAEAIDALAAAGPLAERVRGLVRIGERRWDMVLADGPRILLPAEGAADAVAYLTVVQAGEDILGKDVSVIDLRLMDRPTLRLNEGAVEALEARRQPPAKGREKDA